MHQIAELRAAEGIVAEVLDDGAAIGVGMRLGELFLRESGIALQQEGAESVGPEQVNDLFVGQNGIRGRGPLHMSRMRSSEGQVRQRVGAGVPARASRCPAFQSLDIAPPAGTSEDARAHILVCGA